jgi:hypothetical protein
LLEKSTSSISQIANYTMDNQLISYWPHTWHPIGMMSLICQIMLEDPQLHWQTMPQDPQHCYQRALHPTLLSITILLNLMIFFDSEKLTNQ